MWKKAFIVLCVICVCYCQNNVHLSLKKKKPYSYHHKHKDYSQLHLIFGGLTYLSFLVIKIKILFFFGVVFGALILAAKAFAFIKLMQYSSKGSQSHDHEKIYFQEPMEHSFSQYSGAASAPPASFAPSGFGGGFGGGGGGFGGGGGLTFDKLPPNAVVAGGGGGGGGGGGYNDYPGSFGATGGGVTLDHPPPNAEIVGGGNQGQYYNSPPSGYGHGRSIEEASIYENFMRLMKKMNVSEMAFREMRLESDDCRRRFVCKADYSAKQGSFVARMLNYFRDDSYDKYRTREKISSVKECEEKYPKCDKNI